MKIALNTPVGSVPCERIAARSVAIASASVAIA